MASVSLIVIVKGAVGEESLFSTGYSGHKAKEQPQDDPKAAPEPRLELWSAKCEQAKYCTSRPEMNIT